jgi:hypothetical protein
VRPFAARQIGFDDAKECPHLCTLAYDYLRKNKGYEENIFAFFQSSADPEPLVVKFIEEIDKCIVAYFSFHWKYATYMITQVKGVRCLSQLLSTCFSFWNSSCDNVLYIDVVVILTGSHC